MCDQVVTSSKKDQDSGPRGIFGGKFEKGSSSGAKRKSKHNMDKITEMRDVDGTKTPVKN